MSRPIANRCIDRQVWCPGFCIDDRGLKFDIFDPRLDPRAQQAAVIANLFILRLTENLLGDNK